MSGKAGDKGDTGQRGVSGVGTKGDTGHPGGDAAIEMRDTYRTVWKFGAGREAMLISDRGL